MRRRFSVVLALVALLVTTGCTLPGSQLMASAGAISVDDGVLDATGYTAGEHGTIAINQTVGIAGEDRTVGVENEIRGYDGPNDARFVVFSTPSPDIDGAPANPFADVSERRGVARMFGGINNTSALAVEARRNVTLAGHETALTTYATTNRSADGLEPVLVDIAVVEDSGDAVVAVGVRSPSTNATATERLVEGVDHGGSP